MKHLHHYLPLPFTSTRFASQKRECHQSCSHIAQSNFPWFTCVGVVVVVADANGVTHREIELLPLHRVVSGQTLRAVMRWRSRPMTHRVTSTVTTQADIRSAAAVSHNPLPLSTNPARFHADYGPWLRGVNCAVHFTSLRADVAIVDQTKLLVWLMWGTSGRIPKF